MSVKKLLTEIGASFKAIELDNEGMILFLGCFGPFGIRLSTIRLITVLRYAVFNFWYRVLSFSRYRCSVCVWHGPYLVPLEFIAGLTCSFCGAFGVKLTCQA